MKENNKKFHYMYTNVNSCAIDVYIIDFIIQHVALLFIYLLHQAVEVT